MGYPGKLTWAESSMVGITAEMLARLCWCTCGVLHLSIASVLLKGPVSAFEHVCAAADVCATRG